MIGLFVQVADVINGGGKNCMQTKKSIHIQIENKLQKA